MKTALIPLSSAFVALYDNSEHNPRHTFAVRALEACPCDRDYVGRHILALSTYMGHAHVADTYWYLETTPQLLGDIVKAWETFVKGVRQ